MYCNKMPGLEISLTNGFFLYFELSFNSSYDIEAINVERRRHERFKGVY